MLIFLFYYLADRYGYPHDVVLAKEEDLVPEISTEINFKTIAEKSDDPLKEKQFTGGIICFKILV